MEKKNAHEKGESKPFEKKEKITKSEPEYQKGGKEGGKTCPDCGMKLNYKGKCSNC